MCYRGVVVEGHVVCPACGEENPLDRAFCCDCGEPLVPECVIDMLAARNPDVPRLELRVPR